MAPSTPESRAQSHTPPAARRASSPAQPQSGSPRRTRSRSRSRPAEERPNSASRSRSPEAHEHRNGQAERARSRTRSRSPSREGRQSYRERSYSRSVSRGRRPQSSKIVVEKLSKNVTEAHLQEIFGSYGHIQSIDLPVNRQFMTNRGTAYVVYESAAGSEAAIAHMHEAQLDGAVITVSIVLPRRAFSRSPPPIKKERALFSSRVGPGRGPPLSSHQRSSPPPRRGGHTSGRRMDWDEPRRNGKDYSRSPSPPARRRERSYSYSRSPSRTPPRRRAPTIRSPPRRRRRSPSYSSYSSYSRSRTRSRSRSPSRTRHRDRG